MALSNFDVDKLGILNKDDLDVFSILLSKRDESFSKTREITTDIETIVKEKYASISEENYRSVEESLLKLANTIVKIITSSSLLTFNLLISVTIETSEEGKSHVKVVVGSNFVIDYFIEKLPKDFD